MPSNADRLHALYDGYWKRHDWHAGADVVAPDIEWIGMADDATLGGTRHGARAVNQFFAEWFEAWEEQPHVEWEIEEVTPDLVVVRSSMSARGRGSGVRAEAEIGQVWEFQNGRAIRQTMYRSWAEAREAAEALVG